MQHRLVVAVDGGNSKTELVLATVDGAVLAHVTGGGTRPNHDGLSATADALAALVDAGLEQAGQTGARRVAVAAFYLANVDVPKEEREMHAALIERRVGDHVEVHNDTFAVLRAGSTRGWGIAVVSGAGINAVGLSPEGRAERFLGIGPWSGDWGGSEAVVQSAVAAAVRACDGRGPATVLYDRIVEAFGMDVNAVALAAHHGKLDRQRLLGFAPTVFAAARDGDAVAVQIVQRLGDEVVSFAGALLRRMRLVDADPDVVLGGRILQTLDPVVIGRIHAGVLAIAPAARLRVLDVPPVAGALAGALSTAGATPDQIARSRRYFFDRRA